MAVKILIKSNSISGVAPRVAELSYSELAINTADGHLYTKTTANEIVNLTSWEQLHNKPETFIPTSHPHGNLSNNGNITEERNIGDSHKPVVVDDDGNLFFMPKIDPQTVGGVISAESNVSEEIQQLYNNIASLQEDYSDVVLTSDPRMTDAREPLSHNHNKGQTNIGVGDSVLVNLVEGDRNTSMGYDSGVGVINNYGNTFFGSGSGFSNSSGNFNTAIGTFSQALSISGTDNTSLGFGSMLSNTNGNGNVSVGNNSLLNNSTGEYNVGVGYSSLYNNTTGSHNVAVGLWSNTSSASLSNCIILGSFATALNSGEFVIGSSGFPVNTYATVGITGTAALLPARPLGYLSLRLNGTLVKLPYYGD